MTYIKHEKFWIKKRPHFDENWVHNIIADDPSILGLGDLILRDSERIQPRAGRLDLLLQDIDAIRRYEVELQLGTVDESHIIRTIEYWDIERKRYPQYEHYAVIIAEDITSRFLNVIGLFNGFIPLIALQMSALKMGDNITLVFTKVMDEMRLGLIEEDDDTQEKVDRYYWENKRGTPGTVGMVDRLFEIIKGFDNTLDLNFTKFYIGIVKSGQANNFVLFRPRKTKCNLEIRLEKSEGIEREMEEAGLDLIDYNKWNRYRLRLGYEDIDHHKDLLTKYLKQAYELSLK